MPSPAPLSSVEAIVAAAHQLKLIRLAATTAGKPLGPAENEAKGGRTPKIVRCSVRITKSECRGIAKLKKQLARRGIDASKGELVRAGLRLLVHLDPGSLKAVIRDVIAPDTAAKEGD